MWRRSTIQTLYEILVDRKLKRRSRPLSSVEASTNVPLIQKLTDYYSACLKFYSPLQYSFVAHEDSYIELFDTPLNLKDEVYEQAVLGISRRAEELSIYRRYEPFYGTVLVVESKVVNRLRQNTVHPLVLYPYVQRDGVVSIDWHMPVVNGAAVAVLEGLEMVNATAEAEELTRSFREQVIDEGYVKGSLAWLMEAKPHWKLDQTPASQYQVLAEIVKSGTYFQDVLCLVELSPYTRGLEEELSGLSGLPNLEDSALHALLSSELLSGVESADAPSLLSVLPSNAEQEEAVKSALREKLSVIQGPPGTGKSQVIAQTIMNAVHDGQTVLFVSKNNQAVDIVEERINGLSERPLVLRIRPGSVRGQVVDYLSRHLDSSGVKLAERIRLYAIVTRLRSKYQQSKSRVEEYAQLRNWLIENKVDYIKSGPLSEISDFMLIRLNKILPNIHQVESKINLRYALNFIELRFYKFWMERYSLVFDEGDWNEGLLEVIEEEVARRQFVKIQAKLKRRSLVERVADQSTLKNKTKEFTASYWPVYVASRLYRLNQGTRADIETYRVVSGLTRDKAKQIEQLGDLFDYFKSSKGPSPLPAWATTLLSLKRTTPLQAGLFDVVIFDEASQCDIASALPALARAKRAVVIGDPKQLSHITPHTIDHEKALLRSYGLTGKFMRWSYTQNSLFDLVHSSIPVSQVNLLRDHHRSHEEIIGFSNKYFYGGMLRPKTKPDKLKLDEESCGVYWDDTGTSRIERPKSGSARNIKEARRIVKILERLIEKYPEVSIGIVTPFRAQAEYIKKIVGEALSEELMVGVDLRIGTVHTFQGDERDIIIFSPVVAEGISDGQTRFISRAGNLFNVAITRARSKFIVVGDLIYARTNQIQFYSSFVQYIVDHDRNQQKNRKNDVVRFTNPSPEMKLLLKHSSLVLAEHPLEELEQYSRLESIELAKGMELMKLETGSGTLYLLLDHLTGLMTDSTYRQLEDRLTGLLEQGGLVFSATKDEVTGFPADVLNRLVITLAN